MKKSILVVEDDPFVRESLFPVLTSNGYSVIMAETGKRGFEILEENFFDAAMVDLKLPDMTGLDFLKVCRERHSYMDVMIMTSFGTVETAVEAMKSGACDYLLKPFNDDEILLNLARIFETQRLRKENMELKEELENKRSHFHNMIGADPKMQRIYSIIQAIRDTDATVLLRGESGTGKGMIAQAIHYSDPVRGAGPYIEVSCGAIPRELLESELFGHVKGAFTSAIRDRVGRFELADGGTIVLDEIDALPPYLQVKLLRILQQKVFEKVGDTKTVRVNVRVVASTNIDLEAEIIKGNFREDLYYRLNVITVDVPPLRQRKGDIPSLVDHFLDVLNKKNPRQIRKITKEALKLLVSYDWPGNIRELENTLERAYLLAQSDALTPDSFPYLLKKMQTASVSVQAPTNLKEVLREPERKMIVEALEQAGGNKKKAALILNINRTTLYSKLKKHNLI